MRLVAGLPRWMILPAASGEMVAQHQVLRERKSSYSGR